VTGETVWRQTDRGIGRLKRHRAAATRNDKLTLIRLDKGLIQRQGERRPWS
jgi:hypothetical protein